jgi:segregation and condensation protein B
MDETEKRGIAEALILASMEPIPVARLAKLIPRCTPSKAKALVDSLNADYVAQQRAFEICEVAGGYQMRTNPEYKSYLAQLYKSRPLRLSNAALETLSIVAYRQPVTRGEVEHVRGVDAGPVMRSLLERNLVKIAGHREVPGRPMLYATTKRFLEVFGLAHLEDLPTLRELEELQPTAQDPDGDDEEAAGGPVEAADSSVAQPAAQSAAQQTTDADVSLEQLEIGGKPN